MRNKHLLFKSPSLWYFVRAAQADKDKVSALPITHPLLCLSGRSYVKVFTVSPIRLTSIRARALTALFLPDCPASIPVLDTQEVLLKCASQIASRDLIFSISLIFLKIWLPQAVTQFLHNSVNYNKTVGQ